MRQVETPRDAESARLLARVSRHRRRFLWVRFVRHLCVIAAIAIVSVAIAGAMGRQGASARLESIGVAILASIIVAAVVSFVRRPTLDATGSTIDHRLGLHDRVAAALQHRQSQEPIARLIVSDAARRLDEGDPSRVFPLEVGRPAALVMAALSMALLVATVDVSNLRPREMSGGAGASVGGPSGGTDERGTGDPQRSADAGAVPGPLRTADERTPASVAPAEERSVEPRADAALRDSTAVGQQQRAESAAPNANRAAPAESQRTPTAEPSSAANAGPQTGLGGSGVGNRLPSEALGAVPGGSSARGSGGSEAAGAEASQAGGVSGGTLRVDSVTPAAVAAAGRSSTASRLRVARSQAEAAMSRDDIPPALRKYVRDYFLAMQAGAKP